MAIYSVVKYPDPVLLSKTEEVKTIGDRERLLVRDMIATMYHAKGVGLAANQIGIAKQIFVASPDQERGKELVFFNPQIIARSGGITDEEGCLSVPGYYGRVRRHARVTLRAMDMKGQTVEMQADGLLARIFQHETDHLNGFLYLHRMNFLKKKLLLSKIGREGFGE